MTNVHVTWVENMQFVAQGDSGHAIVMDTDAVGGQDTAARPMEVLLMGLAGCTAMDAISILKKKRQPVQGFKVFVTSERAPQHPKYYTKIHLEYVAYGDVDERALARAVELSQNIYCGASESLRGRAEITSSYRVERAVAQNDRQKAA